MRRNGLWRDPDFLKLWTGQAVSQIGSRISREGLPLTAVLILGASPLQMGIMNGVGAGAVLLVGLFAGVWVDRLRRRPILICADLARAVLLGSVPLAAFQNRLTIEQLYGVAAGAAMLTLVFEIAYQAYLPSLVERTSLVEGNSKLALTESVAEVAGPGITGVLVQMLTAPVAIVFDAVSFLFSAISLLIIRKPETRPERHPDAHVGKELLEGLRASWRDPLLRAMAARTAMASFFLGFPNGLYILFVIRELRVGAAALGLVIAAGGAANLVGALMAGRLISRFGFATTFLTSAVIAGLAALLVPLAHGPVWLSCAFLFAAQSGDVAWPVYTISKDSLLQAIVPTQLLGRVNSSMQILFGGMLPLGSLAGGALAKPFGVRYTILAGAVGFLLSTLWLVFSPIRKLHTIPAAATDLQR